MFKSASQTLHTFAIGFLVFSFFLINTSNTAGAQAKSAATAKPALSLPAAVYTPQTFAVSYDVEISVDKKKATASGMSQSLINGAAGLMGGGMSVGTVADTIQFDKEGNYLIQSSMSLGALASTFLGSGKYLRSSKGRIENNTLNTMQYVDQRPEKKPLTAVMTDKKNVFFFDGKATAGKTAYTLNTQDALSMMYANIGRVPVAGSKNLRTVFTDGKTVKTAAFNATAEKIKTPSGEWDAVKLTRSNAGQGDASIELWVRQSDGLPIRLRLGMSEKYGALMDIKANKLPAVVVKY